MTTQRLTRTVGGGRAWRLAGRWRRDESGASLVQFIVVLPVLALVVVGLWSLFQVYGAQQTLCEAVWESSRYLQVEGPVLDPVVYPYPTGWEQLALGIINTELKSNAVMKVGPLTQDQVVISPNTARMSPQEMSEVRPENVSNNWFFVRASTTISNPLAIFVPGAGPGGALKLTCKGTGFFEGPPIGPTSGPGRPDRKCPLPAKICTPIKPGPPPPTPTACPPGDPCCPVCRPN
jgi:hypothetical protein